MKKDGNNYLSSILKLILIVLCKLELEMSIDYNT